MEAAARRTAAPVRELVQWAQCDHCDDEQRRVRRAAAQAITQALNRHDDSLDLRGSVLTGGAQPSCRLSDLPDLAVLPRLQSLTIDPEAMPSLSAQPDSSLARLQRLSCHGLQTAPQRLPPAVRIVDFSHSPGLTLPDALHEWAQLNGLNLNHCGLRSLPDFSPLKALVRLEVKGNPLESVHPGLYQLPGLQHVDLRETGQHRHPRSFRSPQCDIRIVDEQTERLYRSLLQPPDAMSDADLCRVVSELAAATEWLQQEWQAATTRSTQGRPTWDGVADPIFLPALIHAENRLTPGLHLAHSDSLSQFHERIDAFVADPASNRLRVIADLTDREHDQPLDGLGHSAAIDLAVHRHPRMPPVVTAICIDSLPDDDWKSSFERWAAAVRARLPTVSLDTWQFSGIGIQKGLGCHIYALSTAKKMHDHQDDLDWRHREAATTMCADYEVPHTFYKHTSSMKVLGGLDLASRNAIVNKAGQTLQQRVAGGIRYRQSGDSEAGEVHVVRYNASIEAKRIRFFKRASFVYQQEARRRGLTIDPAVTAYTEVPGSSVQPEYESLRAGAGRA